MANLLENAVKHTTSDVPVVIKLRSAGAEAVIEVRDEGPGIPHEIQEKLFEPFQRGFNEGHGVGLGLFIVANLARAMGGSVTVQSEPGQGATFRVTLPSSAGAAELADDAGRVGEGP